MSIEVAPDALAEAVEDFAFGYLLTLGDAPRPHAVAVTPVVTGGLLRVGDLGRSSRRNIGRNTAVTLLWPPREPGGYSLIVDGDATLDDGQAVITPGRAVLHRPAPPAPQPATPSEDGSCTADCVELPAPSPTDS